MQKINITTIGWGTGTFNVLSGLKKSEQINIAAIVSVADSGGSTGELRDQFGILPPGDIRRALVALAKDTTMVRKLFEYRFEESVMKGHTIGNLLLTACANLSGDFEDGIRMLSDMFDVQGKVIPVTTDDVQLGVKLENGQKIIGETNIDRPKHDANIAISEAFIVGENRLNPRAREVLLNSDFIIIGPGDLYTSIVPNLLAEGMQEALAMSNAKIIYVCNIMTKHGETNGFGVPDFVEVIERYAGKDAIDYVLINNGEIREEILKKYQEESKTPVYFDEDSSNIRAKIIRRNLINESDYARHDPKKLAEVIQDFIDGWIK